MVRKSAFTVIELLIVAAISLVVMGVFADTFIDGWQAEASQETMSELQRASRLTVDEISKQSRSATTVVSSVISDGTTYTSDANTLVLRLPPLDANENIIAGDDYIIFQLNGSDPAITERVILPNAGSSRTSLKTPLSLNRDTGLLTIRYYGATGTELIPGTNDLSPTRRLTILSRSSRTVVGRVHIREIETSINLRNKGL